ncbi:MAG: 4-hydroxy-tetrahydrodipicolinate synthase [Rickettsiaceae bacterium]|nr:4-hydroxy-tetrahydrodipicolinate synthase [Rickettsiaceae bacterium]
MSKFFKGLYTALITPFKYGEIDFQSFEKILQYQLDSKVDGIIIAGSTGEVSTLRDSEFEALLTSARSIIDSKTQMIAGISANIPQNALKKSEIAQKIGVDGIMCVMPYYNKPPQRGLVRYFKEIHENTDLPIMLYSVPSRTGIDFADESIIELANLPRIRGLKDSANDIERPIRLLNKLPDSFSLLSGEDTTCLAYSAHGGVGCVSVIANIFPKICKEIQDFLSKRDFSSAMSLQSKMMPLYKAIFVETNPVPIKFAANILDLCREEVRAPLFPMEDITLKEKIIQEIRNV